MGLFDGILGKKDTKGEPILEEKNCGYVIINSRAKSPKYNGACVFFNAPPDADEDREALKAIIREFGLEDALAPDTPISIVHDTIPDLDEYINAQEISESLNAFIMARVMMIGLARGPAEMGMLALESFDHKGVKGVIVLKEA